MFARLLNLVDDYGRYDGDAEVLAAHLYPRRREVTAQMVEDRLQELATADGDQGGPVALYEVDGRRYLRLVNWERHRGKSKRGKASRWPEPPQHTDPQDPQEIQESPRIPADPRGRPRIPARGSGVAGCRGSEVARKPKNTTIPQRPPADGKRRYKTNCPDTLDPAGYARVKAWASEVAPKTVAPKLDSWIEEALGYYRREGKRFVDWPQAVMDNIRSRVNYQRKRDGDGPLPSLIEAKRVRKRVEKLKAESAARSPPEAASSEPQPLSATMSSLFADD